MTDCSHQPRNTEFQRQMDRFSMKEKLEVVPTMSEQESGGVIKNLYPVAVVDERKLDGPEFMARIRWLYNSVPNGEVLYWAHFEGVEENRLIPESEYQSLLAENARLRAVTELVASRSSERETALRHLLFMQHGSAEHFLYGDDGERHCNTCMCDFNKDSPELLLNKISQYNLVKYMREQQPKASEDDK